MVHEIVFPIIYVNRLTERNKGLKPEVGVLLLTLSLTEG